MKSIYISLCVPGKAQSGFLLCIFHFFLIISAVHHFNTAIGTPTACHVGISGPGYAISIHGGRFSRRLD